MYLIETNRIESQAKIQKSNWDPIKNAKSQNGFLIKRFVFKKSHS